MLSFRNSDDLVEKDLVVLDDLVFSDFLCFRGDDMFWEMCA